MLPDLTLAQLNRLSLAAMVLGSLLFMLLGVRARRPVLLPLGVTLLLWWFFVNKVFSPQYALWVFLGLALLRSAWPLWAGFVAADLGLYYVSFLILFSGRFQNDALIDWQERYLRTPVELLREALLLVIIAQGALTLVRLRSGAAASHDPYTGPASDQAAGQTLT